MRVQRHGEHFTTGHLSSGAWAHATVNTAH